MNTIAVFGATGGTGRLLVTALRERGLGVVAIVRDPTGYKAPPGVIVKQADVLDPSSLDGVLDNVDAVISALGPRDGRSPTTVYSRGMRNIIAQMRAAGVHRLVVISAVPVSPPEENTFFVRHILHPILWRFFGPSYRDLRVMEEELRTRAKDIDWTIVRPPLLTDDPARGDVRRAVDSPLGKPKKISRADLANELANAALDESLAHKTLTVSY
ncbi:putative NADH-flavin reductase [Naumannella cuiyingiana]|uniref:Putative NADH-flavin reductase n=1 Tax=Naumannella cuiyingiana TaxID=1347891 RepID=A0A7Z0IKM6_9ACTN|nr:NAD(P)-binding oxidoreductase [Naumannella cuiyingiana]NYI70745.1 putative NADH-flavin reductase [Naumannella cuiyingiana]